MGDALICNALIRKLASENDQIVIFSYWHNLKSVEFMFRDLKNVRVTPVDSPEEANHIIGNRECLQLGYFGKDFDPNRFDTEFYRQANVDFEQRWNGFKFNRDPESECKCNVPFRFVHDDIDRGFSITRIKEDGAIPIIRPHRVPHIFQFVWMLQNASEIHCINSSFLILADSIEIPESTELFLHFYARPTTHPRLRKKWKILL